MNQAYLYLVTSDHFECLEMILVYNYTKKCIDCGLTKNGYVLISPKSRTVLEGSLWLNVRNDELAQEIFTTHYENIFKVLAAGVKEDLR